jgi:hypothetical protein
LVEKPDGRDSMEDLDLEGKIIKSDIKEIEWIDLDWVHLARNIDKCRLMNLWISYNAGIFLTTWGATNTEWGVCSWLWQLSVWGMEDRLFFVTNNRWIPVKNTLGWSAVVFFDYEILQLFCVSLWVLGAAHKFNFRRVTNEIPNKWRIIERRPWCDTSSYFWHDLYIFSRPSSRVLRALPKPCRSTAYSWVRNSTSVLSRTPLHGLSTWSSWCTIELYPRRRAEFIVNLLNSADMTLSQYPTNAPDY